MRPFSFWNSIGYVFMVWLVDHFVKIRFAFAAHTYGFTITCWRNSNVCEDTNRPNASIKSNIKGTAVGSNFTLFLQYAQTMKLVWLIALSYYILGSVSFISFFSTRNNFPFALLTLNSNKKWNCELWSIRYIWWHCFVRGVWLAFYFKADTCPCIDNVIIAMLIFMREFTERSVRLAAEMVNRVAAI